MFDLTTFGVFVHLLIFFLAFSSGLVGSESQNDVAVSAQTSPLKKASHRKVSKEERITLPLGAIHTRLFTSN